MNDKIIKDFILYGCYGDMLKYKMESEHKQNDSTLPIIDNQWSYIVEVMIITIKSLLPSSRVVGTLIDYKRFKEELKLWSYYRHGENSNLINSVNFNSYEIYWNKSDDSIYSRIIPITFANKDWEIAKGEIIKSVLYTTGKIECLIEALSIGRIVYLFMENKSIEYDEVISVLKEDVINLSQIDFLNTYREYYRVDISTYPIKYNISFEREKIKLLDILNNKSTNENYMAIINVLKIINKMGLDNESLKYRFLMCGFSRLVNKEDRADLEVKDQKFIESLCIYIEKLRHGRIPPENLIIQSYNLPDIFEFKEGEVFTHSLLNKCKVLKKEGNKKNIVSIISTKSGIYRFNKTKTPID